jgi:hypothetical protein
VHLVSTKPNFTVKFVIKQILKLTISDVQKTENKIRTYTPTTASSVHSCSAGKTIPRPPFMEPADSTQDPTTRPHSAAGEGSAHSSTLFLLDSLVPHLHQIVSFTFMK